MQEERFTCHVDWLAHPTNQPIPKVRRRNTREALHAQSIRGNGSAKVRLGNQIPGGQRYGFAH